MIDILSTIVDFLMGLFDFLVKIVTEIIYIIKLTGTIIGNIASYFYFMPAAVSALLITLITIAIAYKIAGRD